MKRAACLMSGWCLFLLGALGTILGIIAILDPIGTQPANDTDPFGVPPSFAESLDLRLLYVTVMALGAWLSFRAGRYR